MPEVLLLGEGTIICESVRDLSNIGLELFSGNLLTPFPLLEARLLDTSMLLRVKTLLQFVGWVDDKGKGKSTASIGKALALLVSTIDDWTDV